MNAYELAELRVLLVQAGHSDWTVREQSQHTLVVHDSHGSFYMYISDVSNLAKEGTRYTAWDGARWYEDRPSYAAAMKAALYKELPWTSTQSAWYASLSTSANAGTGP